MIEQELLKWKVIYTASRQEKKVASYLEKFGVEYYLPIYRSLRYWKDRKKWLELPLFNGYVFVRPTEIQRDEVLKIPGVVKFIRHNSTDAIIPERQLILIREFIELGYSVSQHDASELFEVGDVAEIMEGPLQGQEAEVSKLGEDTYLLVTIEAMNQSFKVKLPKEMLKLRRKKSKEVIKPLW